MLINVGTVKNFLSKALSAQLADNISLLYKNGQLLSAGTGNNVLVNHDKLIRSDKIYWLDRLHDNSLKTIFLTLWIAL